jgi:hypothetical protein
MKAVLSVICKNKNKRKKEKWNWRVGGWKRVELVVWYAV